MNDDTTLDLALAPTHVKAQGPIKKLLKHFSGDDYILEIDNTSLESFLACDRAALYRLVFSRTSYRSAAIIYGSAVHKGLEHLYLGDTLQGAKNAAQKVLAELPASNTEWRNAESLDKCLTGYVKEYFPEGFTILNHNGESCVEQAFSVQMGEIEVNGHLAFDNGTLVVDPEKECYAAVYVRKLHIVWTGVVDLIVQQNDQLWIIDHKTSSVLGPSYYEGFNLSQQFIGYAYAATQIIGRPIVGGLLNVIAGRKPTKSGVSLEFSRRHYLYPTWQLDEWRTDILALVADFVEGLTSGYFPKRTIWCVGKFGTCPYMAVCQLPPDVRPLMLASDSYDNNVWNPLTKDTVVLPAGGPVTWAHVPSSPTQPSPDDI